MKKHTLVWLSILCIALIYACARVPISNRRQVNLIPESEMMTLSFQAYQEFLDTNKVLPANDHRTVMVRNIGQKIKNSVEAFLAENNQSQRSTGFAWEFNVVDDELVNAWCMPGGKVVVYTGILPVTQDEKSLAVVMGHEIAHAIARHGNERMSQGLIAQFGAAVLSTAMDQKPEITKGIFLGAYGIGANLGILGYSRNHEIEADKMGLVFMAMAGYDPNSAIAFWERMAAMGGQKPPQLLSTHPSDEVRIATLREFMPQAMKYYKPTGQ
ncbi:MAG: M48 family metallopeptidase [Flavobacteriales bacterium]